MSVPPDHGYAACVTTMHHRQSEHLSQHIQQLHGVQARINSLKLYRHLFDQGCSMRWSTSKTVQQEQVHMQCMS